MDWMTAAAEEAADHIAPNLRSRFGPKAWAEFSHRLSEHGENLFRLLHRLYGWRFDFAWIYERMIQVAAEGFIDRPMTLRKLDRRSTGTPPWWSNPDSLWAMTYLDRFADTAKGLRDRTDHLASLGVTHLHLLPPFATSPSSGDGGFAVSDYRRLRDGLGTTKQLVKTAADLREIGVTLVLDLILQGTSSDHAWAEAAARGNPRYKSFYFLFSDREVPDRYVAHLRPMPTDREGDAFTWHPEIDGGAWVWSTVSPEQWDLDYSNPDVLAAIAGELLFLANLGAGVIRLNGAKHLWKQIGTDCENLPEAHVIVQVLEALSRIAAPSISFVSGAMVPSDHETSFVSPEECRAAYDSALMSAVWESLATADTRLLARALARRSRLPAGCAWITYLRSHDDIGWWFSDEDARALAIDPEAHRRYLTSFYEGSWAGSVARGLFAPGRLVDGSATISGTAATLAGLETAVEGIEGPAADLAVRRLLAAFAVVLGAGGIPMLFLGDEIAQLSDLTHPADSNLGGDIRWSQRPAFDWPRLRSAEAGLGPEGVLLAGIRRLLEVRRGTHGFGPASPPEPIDPGDNGLIGFRRGPVTVVVNLTDRPVIVVRAILPEGELFDLVTADAWDGHVLGPYEYRYLRTPGGAV
jgi:amylosucrase